MKPKKIVMVLLAALVVMSFLFLSYSEEKMEVPLSAVKDNKYSELTTTQLTKEKVSVKKSWVKQNWLDEQKEQDQYATIKVNKADVRALNTDWDWNWDRGPAPELKKKRVDNPEDYNVQGLRINANFKVDLKGRRTQKPSLKEGTYWVPAAKAGTPNLTRKEIRKLAGKPEEAREKIDVLFEALAFMNMAIRPGSGNVKKKGRKRIRWQYPKPAVLAIKEMEANCAASANVINYLLEDDYDEVGFFYWHSDYGIDRPGGHVVSYIKDGEKYYFFDPVSLTGKKSKFPVEDGDRNYNGDISAHVIQSRPVNYAIYWAQRQRRDVAVLSMYSTTDGGTFPFGSDGNNLYYPASYDGTDITIWEDPNDSEELLQASYTPEPPNQYSNYPPYDQYSESACCTQGKPEYKTIPSDD